ncbi:MAG: type II toxin-antitoxin system HicB family antitoxin [Planctomycetes bacterium]|nr:type II toxin-antitoxin system HicB family antitoxin [Planctomycetota bacterium]
MKLTVVIRKDPEEKSVYNASVPAFPGCHTWGRSRAEALKRAKEAMLVYIESLEARGEPIPKDVDCTQVEVAG